MVKWFRSGTPDEILNNPANDYVRTFFRGVDISQVFSAQRYCRRSPVGLIHKTPGFGPRSTLKLLQDEDREYGYVIERGNKFVGIVSIDSLKAALSEGQELVINQLTSDGDASALAEAALTSTRGARCRLSTRAPVRIGIISKRMLLQA